MLRISIARCGAVVALLGFAVLSRADVTPAPCFQLNTGVLQCGDADSSNLSANQFAIAQFNPQLGQLQSVFLEVNLQSVSGTAYVNFPGIPSYCANAPLFECAGIGTAVAYTISFSSGSLASFTYGNDQVSAGVACCATGEESLPWKDPSSPFGGIGFQTLNYNGGQVSPFIGTGQIDFSVIASAFDGPDGFQGVPPDWGPPFDGATVDSYLYGAEVEYFYTPIPEPSFFFLTAALLGLIVMRVHRRRA